MTVKQLLSMVCILLIIRKLNRYLVVKVMLIPLPVLHANQMKN